MATDLLMSNPNSHPNVLCVDSAQHEVGSLTSILKAQEVPFDAASSTDEALALHGDRHRVTLIASGVRGFLSAASLCRQLKAKSSAAAVLYVASPSRPGDWLDMLEAGADFATPRTLPPRVLAAQISALTRRFGSAPAESPRGAVDAPHTLSAGELTLDLLTRAVRHRAQRVELTRAEFDLLALLCRNRGQVVAAPEVAREVLGVSLRASSASVRNLVLSLRKKTCAASVDILTVRGQGYRLL
jgi:DNA-binding response OmpR family regulator